MDTTLAPRAPADDRYAILAASLAADLPRVVLKHDDAFAVADRHGDLPALPEGEFGFYAGGTRFLRQLELQVHGQPPLLLSATVNGEGLQSAVELTNPTLALDGRGVLPRQMLRIARRTTLYDHTLHQHLTVENFSGEPHVLELAWDYDSDFVDVFEVRGHPRPRRGTVLPPRVADATATLAYRGLDGVTRTTTLTFAPVPTHLDGTRAEYRMTLAPGQRVEVALAVSAVVGDEVPEPVLEWDTALEHRTAVVQALRRETSPIITDNPRFNQWLARSRGDLHLLLNASEDGFVADAGIPWFVAPIGRESLLAALQVLPYQPAVARGTLRYLARRQGRVHDAFTDQEPGKIMHEYRRGEMAACREVPFLPYYGSVDATPLFVMLAAEYVAWTGDRALAFELWPAVQAALGWMREAEAGYLRYSRRSELGLDNQGWRDSADAVMHASGELAASPVALVETQGYAWAALRGGADLAELLDEPEVATALRARAESLRVRFEADFWMDAEQYYALALDGGGEPCRVVSSNPGHCLWTGIVSPSRAELVARRLLGDAMFTGWGLRTLAAGERRYNPLNYHNGSVWPQDTALAAMGLRRYGLTGEFLDLATALFETSQHFEGSRLPELFCGLPRVEGHGPTRHPVACSPQAPAAGVAFQLVTGILGLVPDAAANQLTLQRPQLPEWLRWIELHDLRVGGSRLSLRLSQGRESAAVELLNREGDAELLVRG
jgi:glycogen debranching enzyme